MKGALVRQHPTPQYSTAGSDLDHMPPTPLRGIVLGPSGTGKTVVMVSMLLDHYRGAFSRIFVFSPSVDIDMTWQPVKKYVHETLGVDPDKEQCFFSKWDPQSLQRILDTQASMIEMQKKRGYTNMYGICIVVDDFADSPEVLHAVGKNVINTLFVRGRHLMVSTLIGSQKLRALSTMIRVNAQFFLCFRLRNNKELGQLLEEISAVYPVKTLRKMYDLATADPYSFWYILLTAKRKEDMFFLRFEQKMVPKGPGGEEA